MMTHIRCAKAVSEWISLAQKSGWVVEKTRKGHFRFKAPGGDICHVGPSLGSGRALANAKSDLRRCGLVFPDDERRKKIRESTDEAGTAWIPVNYHPTLTEVYADRYGVADQTAAALLEIPRPAATLEFDLDVLDALTSPEAWRQTVDVDVPNAAPPKEDEMDKQTNGRTTAVGALAASAVFEAPSSGLKDERRLLISFGKTAHAFTAELHDEESALLEKMLETAALLGLSAEDVLEAVKR